MGLFSKKKKKTEAAAAAQTGMSDELIAVLTAGVSASANEEYVAAIAAALAAYEGASSRPLIIRKIDRRVGVLPVWGQMGVREQIDTRRF
jgi:hypothetical protein